MITAEEEEYILTKAYIPEHVVGLMTRVSGGEPYLVESYFCLRKNDWLILVGYPLQRDFVIHEFEPIFDKVVKKFRPSHVSLIAPEFPQSLAASCQERESDHYYTLDIQNTEIKRGLWRVVDRAMEHLTVERSTNMGEAHHELTVEFIERAKPPSRITELLFKMPGYVGRVSNAVVLNAWDKSKNLAAFYVVDLAAKDFSTYVIGCHSKKTYVPYASDLLFFEMIKMSRECGKHYIHLGLGVNKGIRQFKTKWGGIPTRPYEMCELLLRKPSILDAIIAKRNIV